LSRAKTDKFKRDFTSRDEFEQEMLIAETWCDYCGAHDLGLLDPYEFEVNGVVYLEGRCARCEREVVREIR